MKVPAAEDHVAPGSLLAGQLLQLGVVVGGVNQVVLLVFLIGCPRVLAEALFSPQCYRDRGGNVETRDGRTRQVGYKTYIR